MTDRKLFERALEAMEHLNRTGDTQVFDLCYAPELIPALKERLAQPETIIDKSAAIRIATALGWEPPSDTSQERKRWHKAGARAIRMAINIEREACAKVCEEQLQGKLEWKEGAIACAAAIRARGQG